MKIPALDKSSTGSNSLEHRAFQWHVPILGIKLVCTRSPTHNPDMRHSRSTRHLSLSCFCKQPKQVTTSDRNHRKREATLLSQYKKHIISYPAKKSPTTAPPEGLSNNHLRCSLADTHNNSWNMTAQMQCRHEMPRRSIKGSSPGDSTGKKRLISAAVNKHQRISKVAKIQPYDILCGRDKAAFNNTGNRRFRVTINLNLPRYVQANSKNEKSEMILSLVRFLRNDVGVRFLQKKGKSYFELDEKQSRSKVGRALRDMLVAQEEAARKKSEQRDDDNGSESASAPVPDVPMTDLEIQENKEEIDTTITESLFYPGDEDKYDDCAFTNPLHSSIFTKNGIPDRRAATHTRTPELLNGKNDEADCKISAAAMMFDDDLPMPESRAAFFQSESCASHNNKNDPADSPLRDVDSLIYHQQSADILFDPFYDREDQNNRPLRETATKTYPRPPSFTAGKLLKRDEDSAFLMWDDVTIDLQEAKRRITTGEDSGEK